MNTPSVIKIKPDVASKSEAIGTVVEELQIIIRKAVPYIQLSFHPKTASGLYDLRYVTRQHEMMRGIFLMYAKKSLEIYDKYRHEISGRIGTSEVTYEEGKFQIRIGGPFQGIHLKEWPYQCFVRDQETASLLIKACDFINDNAPAPTIRDVLEAHKTGLTIWLLFMSPFIIWFIYKSIESLTYKYLG